MSTHRLTRSSSTPATPPTPLLSRARNMVISSHPLAVTRQRLIVMNMLVVSGILAIMAISVMRELHASNQQVNDQLTHAVTRSRVAIGPDHDPRPQVAAGGR